MVTEKALEKILQEGRERGLYENAFLQVFGAEEVVYAGRAGRATAASLFDVASITKVFTALLVGALVLERRLDDQFRVGDFFPGRVSGPLSLVTVEELLSHTSGLPSWVPLYEEVMNGEGRFTVSPAEKRRETILERLLTLSLESPPGEEIRYSDAGYILLGFLLERGTGKSLKELLRKKITEPLRLMDTGFTPLDEVPHCD
ncbi:MAG: class A beta-lactamase-related serine hydrolase, partial [Deltaproteobacteria bacterium]